MPALVKLIPGKLPKKKNFWEIDKLSNEKAKKNYYYDIDGSKYFDMPKIVGATLLTSEEFKKHNTYITYPRRGEPHYWYLRTPYEDNTIGVVDAYANEEGTPEMPNFIDTPPSGPYGTGLRPALIVDENETDLPWELGDVVVIFPNNQDGVDFFTVISERLLLREAYISQKGGNFHCFDESTNVYERSQAKEIVDNWFLEIESTLYNT